MSFSRTGTPVALGLLGMSLPASSTLGVIGVVGWIVVTVVALLCLRRVWLQRAALPSRLEHGHD